MAIAKSARIHPTAIIGPEADIGDDVQIGPFVVIEGPVTIGNGCIVKAGAHLLGPLTLGVGNQIFSHAVLGEVPQHLKFGGEETRTEIGDYNVFREYVTVHRGTAHSGLTRIGSNNFLMVNSHIAHDCIVGDNCVIANGALVAGHCVIQDRVCLSGNVAVHQHVRVGRLALLGGLSATGMDLPPFMINQGFNTICGVNVVGMRRAGVSNLAIEAVRKAFHVLYRSKLLLSHSLPKLSQELGHIPEVAELVTFIRASKRGVTLDCSREAA